MKAWPLFLLLLSLGLGAASAPGGRDAAKEARIEEALGRIDPSQVPVFHEGTLAMDQGDTAKAERLFAQVHEKAPGFDAAARRLGSLLAQEGRRQEGLSLCRRAVALRRSMENLSSLAFILAVPAQGEGTVAEKEEALRLLLACRNIPPGHEPDVLMLTAQLGLELNRPEVFREAARDLRASHPEFMQTHHIAAILAAMDEHWIQAESEIRIAQRMGLPEKTVNRFLDSGVGTRAMGWRAMVRTLEAAGIWAAILCALFVLGFLLSRLTLLHASRSGEAGTASPAERRLRRVYRVLLDFAGVYYYLSLPVVMVLVAATSCAILYGCLAIGWIPVKLVLLLGLGTLATLWAMGRSLFLRTRQEDPGRPLGREEAAPLWALTAEVAETLGTRPLDEIRITPGTDLAVYERGSWREKMGNRARRVLILGAANLQGFKVDDFRCVLAHEYGHFTHRDTAGGDIALRVQNDMYRFYLAMCEAGQATFLNLAFHFLRLYNFLFRRISHGATRLQEILADRVAAQAYGAAALEGGLRHVIRRSLAFDLAAKEEIQEAIESRRPLRNLYELHPGEEAGLEEAFEKAMARRTSEDDTHPAPLDRFRLVAALRTPLCAPREGWVLDLFRDPQALLREMMEGFEARVAPYRSAGDPGPRSVPSGEGAPAQG